MCHMSELIALIDQWKDAHGQPSDASIARAIGVAPQTLSSWRKRGFATRRPRRRVEAVAEFFGVPYEEYLLQAVLVDAGFRDDDAET